ncbi:hypothetical protein [Cytobacillus dafuensis]|uniref:Uncharacterized protein n=1 Tax=Cytobacillus dafuensis TaxID=1742359 RepID=A0A5B8Z1J4_CYTDA|nr:hypothetical protein [Cytobacillus dafuensis]QED46882.1 hypothetical protein FSZ17_06140 [Cytobacillus dafuensis]
MDWHTIINSNFVGSLLGTSIAGLVTYFALKREINFQKKSREILEIEGFLKVYNMLNGYLNDVIFCIDKILEIVESNNNNYESIQRLQMLTNSIDESLSEIKSLPDEKIMVEIHLAYRVLLNQIKTFKTGANYFMTVPQSEKIKTIETLKEKYRRLNSVMETLNEFKNNQENILKKIKK